MIDWIFEPDVFLWLSPLGIGLDLLGFALLAYLLYQDNKRLEAMGILLRLNRCFEGVRNQYLGMGKVTEQLINEEDEQKRKSIGLLEHNLPEVRECVALARRTSVAKSSARQAYKTLLQLQGSLTFNAYDEIVRVYLKLDVLSEKMHKASKLVFVAVFIVLTGFAFQLVGSLPNVMR